MGLRPFNGNLTRRPLTGRGARRAGSRPGSPLDLVFMTDRTSSSSPSMIVESRRIVFNDTALRLAIRLYADVSTQGDLPQGVITGVDLHDNDGLSATVFVQQSGASMLREAVLSQQKILAALLLLCRSQKIPVPRQADKSLTVAGSRLVLDIKHKPRTITLST